MLGWGIGLCVDPPRRKILFLYTPITPLSTMKIKASLVFMFVMLTAMLASAQSEFVTYATGTWRNHTENFDLSNKSRYYDAKIRIADGAFSDGTSFGAIFLSNKNDPHDATFFKLRYFSNKKVRFHHYKNSTEEVWACADGVNNAQTYTFAIVATNNLPQKFGFFNIKTGDKQYVSHMIFLSDNDFNNISRILYRHASTGSVELEEVDPSEQQAMLAFLLLKGLFLK